MIKIRKLVILCSLFFILFLTSCYNKDNVSLDSIHNKNNTGNSFENLFNDGLIANDNEYIYFSAFDESKVIPKLNLFKCDFDGGNKSILLEVNAKSLNVVNGWIYYINLDDNYIYKVDINGKNNQKIGDVKSTLIYVQDNVLYAIGIYEKFNNNIYSMKISEDTMSIIYDQPVSYFYIYNNYIYYINDSIENISIIGRMNIDGSDKTVLYKCNGAIQWFTIFNNDIFYIFGNTLYKMNFSNNSPIEIISVEQDISNTINVFENHIYYSTINPFIFKSNVSLYNIDMTTQKKEKKTVPLLSKKAKYIIISNYIIEDKLYRNENGKFFVMDLNGSNIKPFPQ